MKKNNEPQEAPHIVLETRSRSGAKIAIADNCVVSSQEAQKIAHSCGRIAMEEIRKNPAALSKLNGISN